MHLYDDIGDSSASFRGSTSSFDCEEVIRVSLSLPCYLNLIKYTTHFGKTFIVAYNFCDENYCMDIFWSLKVTNMPAIYASSSFRDAYSNRQLTPNLELWVEIFCVPTCFHMRIPKSCLSVRTPRKEITLASSISILHWLLIHQWKGIHEYYTIETQKFEFFFKVRNWTLTCAEELKLS